MQNSWWRGQKKMFIMIKSHEPHGVLNQQQLSCWFNSLFNSTIKKHKNSISDLHFHVMTSSCKKHFNSVPVNTSRPRQSGCHFADIFKCIFLNENVWISIKTLQNFVPMGSINNILSLVQIMAWRRSGDMPLSEPMMVSLLTAICIAPPQWVNHMTLWRSSTSAGIVINLSLILFHLVLYVKSLWRKMAHFPGKITINGVVMIQNDENIYVSNSYWIQIGNNCVGVGGWVGGGVGSDGSGMVTSNHQMHTAPCIGCRTTHIH